jgi:uncharacterized protein YndB with AHSA1/START domain
VPTARRSRHIAAPVQELWDVIADPHHLPRWWPRVARVEDVDEGAFTEVMKTARGKVVRADFQLVDADEAAHTLKWEQRLEGSPFARILSSAVTLVSLEAANGGTHVTIELQQTLAGLLPRFGAYMVRRAAAATIDEALDGLERISG